MEDLNSIIFRLLVVRRQFWINKDYKISDFLRNVLLEEGIEIEDIPTIKLNIRWLDNNWNSSNFYHFKCHDLHECIKYFDHEKRKKQFILKLKTLIRKFKNGKQFFNYPENYFKKLRIKYESSIY